MAKKGNQRGTTRKQEQDDMKTAKTVKRKPAPYGYKKDGEPRKRPGPRKGKQEIVAVASCPNCHEVSPLTTSNLIWMGTK
jgi:hypothetical protein